MHTKQTIILAQIFISLMMALLMTGIFSFVEMGISWEWLYIWAKRFVIAWPIAFILSLFVSSLGFKLAIKLTS